MPRISVIMPAYNAERYISVAIDSIINQSYKNWEMLIADDCSIDGTKKIIDNYKDGRIKTFHNKNNLGYLKTCNLLFKECTGDFITFQDADDWSNEDRLNKQLGVFEQNKKIGICGTFIQYHNENGKPINRIKKLAVHSAEIKKNNSFTNQFCGATIMIPKNVYQLVGGYRDFFDRIGSEDYDWSSLIIEKFDATNIPEPLYHVRLQANSISRRIINVEQAVSSKYVQHFIKERQINNRDSIQENQKYELAKLRTKLTLKYQKDKSLFHRENANYYWYNGYHKQYVLACWKAILCKPLALVNWKYLIHSIIRVLKS